MFVSLMDIVQSAVPASSFSPETSDDIGTSLLTVLHDRPHYILERRSYTYIHGGFLRV